VLYFENTCRLLPLAPAWRRGGNPNSPRRWALPHPHLPHRSKRARPSEARLAQAAARLSRHPARWGGHGSPLPGRSLDLPPGCRAGGAPLGADATGSRTALVAAAPRQATAASTTPTRSGGAGRRGLDGRRLFGDGCGGSTSGRWWCSCTRGWQRRARTWAPGLGGGGCGAGSMATRGVAAPGSSGLLASWWCM
jgi:hypothetical protein